MGMLMHHTLEKQKQMQKETPTAIKAEAPKVEKQAEETAKPARKPGGRRSAK